MLDFFNAVNPKCALVSGELPKQGYCFDGTRQGDDLLQLQFVLILVTYILFVLAKLVKLVSFCFKV